MLRPASGLLIALSVVPAANAATLMDLDFDSAGVGSYTATGGSVFGSGQSASEFATGNALYFNGNSTRTVTFSPVDLSSGGTISFDFRIGSYRTSSSFFEGIDSSSENVFFSYSLDGVTFTPLETISSGDVGAGTRNIDNWSPFSYNFGANAGATGVLLRFNQQSHSGSSFDHWAIDNLLVSTAETAAVPEPSTWAMMLLGFGAVGGAMRRSKAKQKLTLSFA